MGRRLLRLLVEHTPFYPLSALSMLSGCYLLSHALALRPGQTGKLLLLLLTVNVYQALLIGLGLFLIVRRGLSRDGTVLLVLEVLFLGDLALLDGECFASDFLTGTLVSTASLVLAALKVGVVLRVLDRRVGRAEAMSLAPPGVLLFATPGLFAFLARHHLLTASSVYAAWWAAGLTVVAAGVLMSSTRPVVFRREQHPAAEAFQRALAIVVPASLMVHLAATGWVNTIEFHVAYLGPVLLALGALQTLFDERYDRPWSLRLPAAAILLSLGAPDALLVHGPFGSAISPLRVALLGAGLVYLLGFRLHRVAACAWAAGLCFAGAAAGHSVLAIAASLARLWRGARSGGGKLVPRTASSWGLCAVAGGFVLLGLGALASLAKGRPARPASRAR